VTWKPIHSAPTLVFHVAKAMSRPMWVRGGGRHAVAVFRGDSFRTDDRGHTIYAARGWEAFHTGRALEFEPRHWKDYGPRA
jgi:hypothetical protein